METVIVVENFLSEEEITFLLSDIELFSYCYDHFRDDLSEYGSALDPFEMINIAPNSSIRSTKNDYLRARWKYVEEKMNINIDQAYSDEFNSLVFVKFPSLIKSFGISELFLFNEQYIVKDPDSMIAFRWHRDESEQLNAFLTEKPRYFSLWCNLDNVNNQNGTISFRNSATVLNFKSFSGKLSSIFN
jgi:hypothetical protein